MNSRIVLGSLLAAAALCTANPAAVAQVRVTVDAARTAGRVSPYLTGACIEDVNHEIYGGLYSQMIFGESFQEPAPMPAIAGFKAFGGTWTCADDELRFSGAAGDKLVSDLPAFGDGQVGLEIFMADRNWSNVGLVVRVGRAAAGVDSFDGYEISLNATANVVRLGRHRHDWRLIRDEPCPIPIDTWIPVVVKLAGRAIEISVSGKTVLRHEDTSPAALHAGTIGLRAFQTAARYRRLWVATDGQRREIPFKPVSRELPQVSGMWSYASQGTVQGRAEVDTKNPFLGKQAQRLVFTSGQGSVGIVNQGLNRWGLNFVAGKTYEGVIWGRCDQKVEMFTALESKDGAQIYAEKKLVLDPVVTGERSSGGWQRLEFKLRPNASDTNGGFRIGLRQPGTVTLGYAALQPGAWGRFKGLPVRRDVAEAMIDQGLTVLRYGGSMVNHPEYRWKKMIGPRERREPYQGTWYPHSSNGWGILDFLDFCEAADFLAIPAFNMDETPQDMADFIEYVNGPKNTEWGAKRAQAGHARPYRLQHLELGNEERVDETYFKKFKALAEAIWSKDPEIVLVVGDFVYGEKITDPFRLSGAASGIKTLAAQKEILALAKAHNREVWFDLHVGTDGPRPDSTFNGMFSFLDALGAIADGARYQVAVFEFNAGNHSMRRALGNALAMNAIARDGRIPVATSANGLQPDGQNDNGWDQGLLFLNPSRVWLQPPGYVTRMISRNYQPLVVAATVQGAGDKLDVFASTSRDGRVVVLQTVNVSDQPIAAEVELGGLSARKIVATVEILSGSLDDRNTAAEPERIKPTTSEWRPDFSKGPAHFTFPARSVTVIRMRL